jgi:putative transposase
LLIENALEDLREPMTLLLNEAMKLERARHLGAAPWERSEQRSEQRTGHANGYKDKTLKTRIGELALKVPQTREGDFYPGALERGERSERAVKLALAELYVHGVSTRKVATVVEQLCGFEVSSSDVSRAAAQLDDSLSAWRCAPMPACSYVVLDARYEKVHHGGQVLDCAGARRQRHHLCGQAPGAGRLGGALGGRSGLANVSHLAAGAGLERSEAVHRGRSRRAQGGASSGVSRSALAALPVSSAAERSGLRPEAGDAASGRTTVRAIFHAPDRAEAERLLKLAIDKFEKSAPQLAAWMGENIPEGSAVFALDPALRAAANHQRAGALEQGNQAAHPCGNILSQ